MVEELTSQQKELEKLEHYMQQLQPVADVGINLDAVAKFTLSFWHDRFDADG